MRTGRVAVAVVAFAGCAGLACLLPRLCWAHEPAPPAPSAGTQKASRLSPGPARATWVPVELSAARKRQKVRTARAFSNYVKYDSVPALEQAADAIVVGRPAQDFLDRRHLASYMPDGHLAVAATEGELQVLRVIKGPAELLRYGQTLPVVEPTGLVEGRDGGLVLIEEEGTKALKQGSAYILFLKKNEMGSFSIINMNLGKFNLDGTDPEDDLDETVGPPGVATGEATPSGAAPGKPTEKQRFKAGVLARYQALLQ